MHPTHNRLTTRSNRVGSTSIGDNMPFKKASENGGVVDKNINTAGRKSKKDKKSPRQLRNSELENLLRKIKPHVSKSVMVAVKIMDKEEDVTDASKLKAATIILDLYKNTVQSLYDGAEPDEDENLEELNSAPVFSLTVVDNSED